MIAQHKVCVVIQADSKDSMVGGEVGDVVEIKEIDIKTNRLDNRRHEMYCSKHES